MKQSPGCWLRLDVLALSLLVAGVSLHARRGLAQSEPPSAAVGDGAAPSDTTAPAATAEAQGERFEVDVNEALAQRGSSNVQVSSSILTSESTDSIMRNAYLTLSDWLQTVPGFTVASGGAYDFPGARGIPGSVSFLIDGVNYTSPIDYRYTSELGLFLEEFDRINVISGPAGVPWGAYSFLGVINATTGRSNEEGLLVRTSLGNRNLQRIAVRSDIRLGNGGLRLFAGFASMRKSERTPDFAVTAVQPYAADTIVAENDRSVSIQPDTHVVLSARYASPGIVAYLRLPFSNMNYGISDVGAVLDGRTNGNRKVYDGFGFVSLQRSFFEGRVSGLARLVWHGIRDRLQRGLLPPSADVIGGAVSLQDITMSQFNLIGEMGWRYQSAFFSSEAGGGVEGQMVVVHDSVFAAADPNLGGNLVSQGDALPPTSASNLFDGSTPLSGSVYGFDEIRILDRFSVFGGARYNRGNNFRGGVLLWQANAGARLFGKTYVKVGRTAGMRPPTLLDQIGLRPITGRSDLEPERARALQFEANTAFSLPGIIDDGFVRADYSMTTTENNIVREGQRFTEYEFRPVSTEGFDIRTAEAVVAMRLFKHLDFYGMAQRNTVQRPSDSVQDGADRTVPNRGYDNRFVARLGYWPLEFLRLQGAATIQCGGTRLTFNDAAGAFTSPVDLQNALVSEKLGCEPFVDFNIMSVVPASNVSITAAVTNITDRRPASAFFSATELQGAEPPNLRWRNGRTFFVTLQWSPAQSGLE